MAEASDTPRGPDLSSGTRLEALDEGQPFAGHVDGEAVVLVRRGDEVLAIGAHCTHYGAHLADGLAVGDTVRCPWHHTSCCDCHRSRATPGCSDQAQVPLIALPQRSDGASRACLSGTVTAFTRAGVLGPSRREDSGAAGSNLWMRRKSEAHFRIAHPDSVHAIARLHMDDQGYLWIGRREEPYSAWTPPKTFEIVAPEGAWVGRLSLPEGAGRLLDVRAERVLTEALDRDTGVPVLRIHRLDRSAPPR